MTTTGETTQSTLGRIRTVADLDNLKGQGLKSLHPTRPKISVGMATCGLATGAGEVFERFCHEVESRGLDVLVTRTACIGFCQMEPIVAVELPGKGALALKQVKPAHVQRILEKIAAGELPRDGALCTLNGSAPIDGVPWYTELGFYSRQVKIALRNCGFIDPDNMPEYVATGGYYALHRTLASLRPGDVVSAVKRSGLRGRGGAGFPTGVKWEAAAAEAHQEKFVVCNADEGDPGAYMDRSILEGDPHAVLEGMMIGAYAIGANQGVIYVRDEYPEAIRRFERAVSDALATGVLGRDIFGSGFDFGIRLVRGGGAFVCGEETALIDSVEGRPGEPRQRPPFPAQQGLWGCPTIINNVETWANVPQVLEHGPDWFSQKGSNTCKGTKVFSLVGKVTNTGLIEVPMGLTLREIIFGIGGGVPNGKRFKAIQTGGPSGGCLPESQLDLGVDYDQLTSAGTIMGSGGMIVMDEDTCMVDVARYFLDFLKEESCGKCTPCREGIGHMLAILNDICEGRGTELQLCQLEETAQAVQDFSLCGLGQTAPNPVLTTLRYFRQEYESHIRNRKCPGGVCKELITFSIDPELCSGCGLCLTECPTGAVVGELKKTFCIDEVKCIKCSACYEVCNLAAVRRR